MGEQVAGKAGYGWFDGVRADLEETGYAGRAVDIPALAVNAPHIRQRLYWVALDVANAPVIGREKRQRQDGQQDARGGPQGRVDVAGAGANHMAHADGIGSSAQPFGNYRAVAGTLYDEKNAGDQSTICSTACSTNSSFWSDAIWLTGSDGKARRSQPGLPLLAHGIPNRVGRLRAYGNAIVPQVAAEVIAAYMESV
jgi:DNA (cytosine-5)-methyltransferase 1